MVKGVVVIVVVAVAMIDEEDCSPYHQSWIFHPFANRSSPPSSSDYYYYQVLSAEGDKTLEDEL